MKPLDQEDYQFLLANARAGRALGLPDFVHLDQPIGLWNYIRIANDIAHQTPPGRLLDWGCGYGQMTYLLQRRNFQVTPFDIDTRDAPCPIFLCAAACPSCVPRSARPCPSRRPASTPC